MRRIYIAAGVVALLVLSLFAGWYYLSPGWTLKSMVEAAEAKDEARFSSYVDYPALKKDVQDELAGHVEAEAKKRGGSEGAIMRAIGRTMAPRIADKIASPAGLQAALASVAGAAGAKGDKSKAEPEITRTGFGSFTVGTADAPGSVLVFARRGLGWKLVGIDTSDAQPPAAR